MYYYCLVFVPDPNNPAHGVTCAVALGCAAVVFAAAVPLLAATGKSGPQASPAVAAASQDNARRGEQLVAAAGSLADVGGAPKNWDDVELTDASQITYLDLRDGTVTGTANQRTPRSALSLSKLYIADYVLDHGSADEKFEALEMVATSDDPIAKDLYEAYPEAIDATAKKYDLESTRSGTSWGYAVTSTYDAVSYIFQVMRDDAASPILVAMARSAPIAADGYKQDFGTAVLPGARGTKWAWSNDRAQHTSVTFGKDFIAAAAGTGSANDLTALVNQQIAGPRAAAKGGGKTQAVGAQQPQRQPAPAPDSEATPSPSAERKPGAGAKDAPASTAPSATSGSTDSSPAPR